MKKLGIKGKAWLKGLHIFFSCAWIGTGLSLALIGFLKGHTANGDELYAFIASMKLIDDYIIIPSANGCLITGLLLCWLTNWGFFKYNWIVVKLGLIIFQIIFGTFFLGKWINKAFIITNMERGMALQNQTYITYIDLFNYFAGFQALLLIITIFISVFKPWGKRENKKNLTATL